jgi:hypothetical protein
MDARWSGAARACNRTGGRPIAPDVREGRGRAEMRANGQSIVQIARILGVHPATLYPQLSIEPDQPQLAGAS